MSEPPKSSVDPTKITGPYPLLAFLLIVVEGLLGFWFFKAEGPIERSVAGILMTAVLLGVIAAVIRIADRSKLRVRGLDTTITVARQEVTSEQISSPEPEAMAGPDGSYLINRPPPDWTIRDSSVAEWAQQNLGIEHETTNQPPAPAGGDTSELRAFRSPRIISAIPVPGTTKIDGRQFPSALEVRMPTMLTIFPVTRAQPPFYVERPLSHNFLKEIAGMANLGTMTLRTLSSGTLTGSGRKFQKAEFSQRLEDATIDGKKGQSADLNITVLGIESDLCDYILMMHYASRLSGRPDVEADQEALLSLVNSFRPLKLANPEQKRAELKEEAEKQLKQLLKDKGAAMFFAELGLTFLRIKKADLHDAKVRLQAIELLRPYKMFAKEIGLNDPDIEPLFLALDKAEAGDATEFIEQLQETIAEMDAKSEETVPPPITPLIPGAPPESL